MKMIWVTVPCDNIPQLIDALDRAGFAGMTRLPAAAGPSKRPMEVLMIAVPEMDVAKAVTIIRANSKPDSLLHGSGRGSSIQSRIFVTYIDETYTIRTYDIDRHHP